MIYADLTRAALLAAFTLLLAAGHANLPTLALLIFTVGVISCLFDSAAQGMIPALVGRDSKALDRVNGQFWTIDTIGRTAGPALGSLAFPISRILPFAADAVTFLISAALVRRLPEQQRPTAAATDPPSILTAIREGLAHALRNRDLRTMLTAMVVNNSAFAMAIATLVLYAQQVLHQPAAYYGILLALFSLGGAIGGLLAERLVGGRRYNHVIIVACAATAVIWACIAAFPNLWVTAALFVLLGPLASCATVAVVSARQKLTPDELLGRVTSVFRIGGVGLGTIGALLGGVIAAAYGLRAPMYVAAILLAALTLFVATRRGLATPTERMTSAQHR